MDTTGPKRLRALAACLELVGIGIVIAVVIYVLATAPDNGTAAPQCWTSIGTCMIGQKVFLAALIYAVARAFSCLVSDAIEGAFPDYPRRRFGALSTASILALPVAVMAYLYFQSQDHVHAAVISVASEKGLVVAIFWLIALSIALRIAIAALLLAEVLCRHAYEWAKLGRRRYRSDERSKV